MSSREPDRREFLGSTLGMLGAGVLAARAQEKRNTPIRRPDRYDDTFIFERKPFTWPGGKTLAVRIIPNVEVWQCDSPADAAISPNAGNRASGGSNYPRRAYG